MSDDALRKLAEDTLYKRRMHRDGSCFTWNIAGEELRTAPPDVLPVIEAVVRDVLVPALDLPEDKEFAESREALIRIVGPRVGASVADQFGHRFPGLTEFLGAYLVVGSHTDPERIFSFVRGLPSRLLGASISAVPIYFGEPTGPNSVRVPPTAELTEFLQEMSSSQTELIRDAAMCAIDAVRKSRRPRKR